MGTRGMIDSLRDISKRVEGEDAAILRAIAYQLEANVVIEDKHTMEEYLAMPYDTFRAEIDKCITFGVYEYIMSESGDSPEARKDFIEYLRRKGFIVAGETSGKLI